MVKNDTLHFVINNNGEMKYQKYYKGNLCYEWTNNICEVENPILMNDNLELISGNKISSVSGSKGSSEFINSTIVIIYLFL